MDELQEMREQLAALKEKLNKQEVVNDRLIRDMIAQKLRKTRQSEWMAVGIIICLFVLFVVLTIVWKMWDAVSLFSVIASAGIVIGSIIMAVLELRMIRVKDVYSGSLDSVIRKVISNRHRIRNLRWGYFLGLTTYCGLKHVVQDGLNSYGWKEILFSLGVWIAFVTLFAFVKKMNDKKEIKEWLDFQRNISEMTELKPKDD